MKHRYIHRLQSGNVVAVTLTLPLPCEYDIEWQRPGTSQDISEYRTRLQPAIVADLTAIDGQPHSMSDYLASCLANGQRAPRQRRKAATK